MSNDTVFGLVLGTLVTGASIAGNAWRADPHLISTYPGVLTVLLVPVVVYFVVWRRARAGVGRDALRRYGLRLGTVSGAVFAVGLALFTAIWFSGPSLSLVTSGALLAFGLTIAESWGTAAVAARIHAATPDGR